MKPELGITKGEKRELCLKEKMMKEIVKGWATESWALKIQLAEANKEIERLQGRLEILAGVVESLEKEIEDIKDSRYA